MPKMHWRTPVGELMTLPQSYSRLGRETPVPMPYPPRRLYSRTFGTWILVPPPPWKPGDPADLELAMVVRRGDDPVRISPFSLASENGVSCGFLCMILRLVVLLYNT